MINFASLFSQFRNNSGGSAINDLVEDPNTAIQKLLDEQSFSNEYKSGNSKVVQQQARSLLSLKYPKIRDLVRFVTEVGPADDKKRGYKYPLVACEILSAENSGSIDFFFPEGELFDEAVYQEEQQVEQEVEDTVETPAEAQEMVDEATQEKTVIKDQLENVAAPENPDEVKEKETSNKQAEKPAQDQPAGPIQPTEQTDLTLSESTPKKKIIKTTVMVQKTQKVKVQPLISDLFAYYKGQINYPLAGYVSKILTTFFSKKPLLVMDYLLNETRFEQLLNHIESRSVGELVTKILTHESTDLLKQRQLAFERCLARLSLNSEMHVMSNLSLCICDIIEKISTSLKNPNPQTQLGELGGIFFTTKVVSKLIMNLMSELENVSVYNAPILLTYLTSVTLSIPENEAIKNQFKGLLDKFLSQVVTKLRVTRDTRKNLGFGRVKIIEILSYILKVDLLGCRNKAAENKELFGVLFNLWRNYPMNNIMHNQVMKIVQLALNEQSKSPFLQTLLSDDVLLKFLVEEDKEDMKIRNVESKGARKGYIGHVIVICQRVDEKSASNATLEKLAEREQFKKVFNSLVEQETIKQNKSLAGYSLRKNPQNILLAKQEIAQAHFKFLSSCPPPLFEPERSSINIQHPDLEATHTISTESTPELITAMATNAIQSEQLLECNPKYWINHIEYDLDGLMDDL